MNFTKIFFVMLSIYLFSHEVLAIEPVSVPYSCPTAESIKWEHSGPNNTWQGSVPGWDVLALLPEKPTLLPGKDNNVSNVKVRLKSSQQWALWCQYDIKGTKAGKDVVIRKEVGPYKKCSAKESKTLEFLCE
jgi:hypothetical protein